MVFHGVLTGICPVSQDEKRLEHHLSIPFDVISASFSVNCLCLGVS